MAYLNTYFDDLFQSRKPGMDALPYEKRGRSAPLRHIFIKHHPCLAPHRGNAQHHWAKLTKDPVKNEELSSISSPISPCPARSRKNCPIQHSFEPNRPLYEIKTPHNKVSEVPKRLQKCHEVFKLE